MIGGKRNYWGLQIYVLVQKKKKKKKKKTKLKKQNSYWELLKPLLPQWSPVRFWITINKIPNIPLLQRNAKMQW